MVWPALAVIVLDQGTKWAVVQTLKIHESVPIIHGFFSLVHVRNRGMAFGFMNRPESHWNVFFLVGASLLAIAVLLFLLMKLKEGEQSLAISLSLILGGAIGNLIDRIRLREVIDFLDFHVGSYHWPAFNMADSAITVGTIWLAVLLLFRKKTLG
jgi:signal peptidase II